MAKKPAAAKQNKSLFKLIEKYYADLGEFARQGVRLVLAHEQSPPTGVIVVSASIQVQGPVKPVGVGSAST